MVQMAREKGFKVLVASRGDSGLSMANEYLPHAITLDIQLPVVDGWSVLERLKRNPRTRHIPVHIISVMDKHQGNAQGAFGYLTKPVSKEGLERVFGQLARFLERKERRLLLVEDDDAQRDSLDKLLGEGDDVKVTAVPSGQEALRALDDGRVRLPRHRPAAAGHGRHQAGGGGEDPAALPGPARHRLHRQGADCRRTRPASSATPAASSSRAASRARISSWATPRSSCTAWTRTCHPGRARPWRSASAQHDGALAGKKVLVVDDDMRNIFALTSVLENHGLQVSFAENGRAAIESLRQQPDVDVVLMDIMMPEMDGYETMRAIRQDLQLSRLPIIAVTAKALKDDREKCMAAGASDYLPKPVDTDKLIELIRLWVNA